MMSLLSMTFQPPQATPEIGRLIPETAESFGQGLWNVLQWAIHSSHSSLGQAMSICLSCISVVLFCAMLRQLAPAASGSAIRFAGCTAVSCLLLYPSSALISLGVRTAEELSEYGKLLLPVMTGALAAQGGTASGAALYASTAMFNAMLSRLLTKTLVPFLYLMLGLSIASCATGNNLLGALRDLIRWAMTWTLKIVLYLFTGYITVTGVVTGTADAAAVRAAKITISGAVPVVGGILSDASEAVMISAATLGNAAGIYGLLTVLALFAGPFLRIGIQYLLLKASHALCAGMEQGSASDILSDFGSAMGLIMGMVSTQTALLLISTMCFMKGVT